MKIKNLVTDVKAWMALVVVVVIITATIMGYAQLPKKVKAVEEEVEETKDQVQKLAGNIDKYIAVQTVMEKSQDAREELMIKLIEQLKDK